MKQYIIIRNEWLNLYRSRVAMILLIVLLLLSGFTVWQAYKSFDKEQQIRTNAAKYMRNKFLSQGEVNPHSAAHYGHFVYKPLSALSVLDEGVNPFTGVSLRLEGHRQNETLFSPSQNSSSLIRFGELNLGLVLQILFPLLIIFVCHNVITEEKEKGRLSIILTQGATLRQLVWSKILSFSIVWVISLTISMGVLLLTTSFGKQSIQMDRFLGLFLLYSLYYFIITSLSVYVSAKSRTSSNALIIMLFGWLICTVLLPKATANIGENVVPLMSRVELEKKINEDNKNGINGHDPSNERTQRFKDSLLKVYQLDSLERLPVNLDGLLMQEDEEYHNIVYDKHLGNVQLQINRQNSISTYSSWLNPFAAIRSVSASLSGTDIHHHFDFTTKAEDYRRAIIKKMNNEQAYGGSKTGDWKWAVKADFWNDIDDFNYHQPDLKWALRHNSIEIMALLTWLLIAVLCIHFTSNYISTRK